MRSRAWGALLVLGGAGLDAVAALLFSGYRHPPEWLQWLGWPGFLLPGLLASAFGLALLVRRPRGWLDSAADRRAGAPTRVATSLAGLVAYLGAAAALYAVVTFGIVELAPPCLDASCNLFGMSVAGVLGVVALASGPVTVLLLGLAQVLEDPGRPVR